MRIIKPMILTCPHCETKFELDSALLGDEGRKVKCSSCAEVWFQEPAPESKQSEDVQEEIPADESDENLLVDEEVAADIPDVAPADTEEPDTEDSPEDAEVSEDVEEEKVEPEETEAKPEPAGEDADDVNFSDNTDDPDDDFDIPDVALHPKAKLFGFLGAVFVFALVFAGLLIFRTSLMNAFPSMIALYKPLGLVKVEGGDELVFDKVALSPGAQGHMRLRASIVNLGAQTITLPHVKATLLDSADHVLGDVYIKSPQNVIDGESAVEITHMLEGLNPTVRSIRLNFVLQKRQRKTGLDDHLPKDITASHHESDSHAISVHH
jgi:predicted Zn finger-like uncharacterized protein